MLGNVVTGCSVLAPAGMLADLSAGLDISIRTAGLLVTFGAIVLCIGSPVTAWLTSRIERRTLLAATIAVLALANFASALAPDYASLMAIRLVMLAVGALYTPQAAGTGALIVPEERRGSTIAYLFLGWSLAAAVGLPSITFIASRYGWQAVYGAIGLMGCVSFLLLVWRLPRGLIGAPVDLKTWATIGRNPMILALLLITTLQMSGQFVVFTYMGPLLARLTGAGPDPIALVFACYGACGVIGTFIASRIVDSWGAWKTSLCSCGCCWPAWRAGRSAPAPIRRWRCPSRSGASGLPRPIRCSRSGWSAPRPRLQPPRCRSTPRRSISGRRPARRSAAFCTPAISSTPQVTSPRRLSRWQSSR
jgi:DHA1 family inner membrane transport protein